MPITDDSTPSSSQSDSSKHAAAAAHLEEICARIIGMIRARNWTHPDWEELVADNFVTYMPAAFLENLPSASTKGREEYIESYKAFMELNPNYDCIPLQITAHVDESGESANVWIVMDIAGHPSFLRRESVSILHWKLRARGWVAVKQTGLRGCPPPDMAW